MSKFDQIKYQNQWQKEKLDVFNMTMPKGTKKPRMEHAKRRGFKSFNAFLNHLVDVDVEKHPPKEKNEE